MHAVTGYFFTFSISKNYRFLKQMTNTAFHNTIIPSTIYLQELAAFDDAYLSWGWSKIWFYCTKEMILLQ